MSYPIPFNENERLKELRRLEVNQCDHNGALQQLCSLASRLMKTPIALVSLVGNTDQTFAAKIGMDAEGTSREVAFCAHAIMKPELFVVENATEDLRFSSNPLVTGPPGIRAYAGIPLETAPGLRVGTLCAIDTEPHKFTKDQLATLSELGRIATSILKARRTSRALASDLLQAAAIQRQLLPGVERLEFLEGSFPIRIAGHYEASDAVGGDLWGIEALGRQRLLIYNADFAGHGLAAALNTVRLHSLMNWGCRQLLSPAAVMQQLNSFLCDVLPTGDFATMFCAILDFRTQRLEYASAACPPWLYRMGPDQPFRVMRERSYPLGMTREATFETRTVSFAPGGALISFSDALIETPQPPNSVFTTDSLLHFVNESEHRGDPRKISETILDHFNRNVGLPPLDDLTLLSLQYETDRAGER